MLMALCHWSLLQAVFGCAKVCGGCEKGTSKPKVESGTGKESGTTKVTSGTGKESGTGNCTNQSGTGQAGIGHGPP